LRLTSAFSEVTELGTYMPEEIIVPDSLQSGVTTDEMIDAEPYCFRVTWIAWDSSFRDSGLQIGDRVIGIDGERYDRARRKEFVHKAFGMYSETQHWQNIKAEEGHGTTVMVKRRGEVIAIAGSIRGERRWTGHDGRRTLGPNGPDYLSTDGFDDGSWTGWYEKQVKFMSNVLDGAWLRRINTRNLLKEHLEAWPRVEFYLKKYPGPFADVLKADWEAVRDSLVGSRYNVTTADLAYRELGDKRAAQVTSAARAARAEFVRAHSDDMMPDSPIPDPMSMEARERAAGKLVTPKQFRNSDWFNEGGKAWLCSGSPEAAYFVDAGSPSMRRMFDAAWRYSKLVSAKLPEVYSVIGRIGPNPKMLVRKNVAWTGLQLDPAAVTIGDDHLFVDLTVSADHPPFAGEGELADPGHIELPDDAAPEMVVNAFFSALKLGSEPTWKALFATWEALRWHDGKTYYTAYKPPSAETLSREWLRARRLILDRIYDARVSDTGEIQSMMDGSEFEGAPKVEQVLVTVDHIGLFDGEYRAFSDIDTHRLWPMQRRDGGPWRLAADWGI
jgi:hypothetical protein